MHIFFGDQLFYNQIVVVKDTSILMIESRELAKRYNYHKYKLVYIFTCMREFRDDLRTKGKNVTYYTLDQDVPFFETLIMEAKKHPKITFFEPADYSFRTKLYAELTKHGITFTVLPNPNFLYTPQEFSEYYTPLKQAGRRILMHDFYIHTRKKYGILIDSEGKPFGNKWSFDDENRKKLPKTEPVPQARHTYFSDHYELVSKLINKHFSDNPGIIPHRSYFALNHAQAKESLAVFMQTYFIHFGAYEDALTSRDHFVFHSALSPVINCGILCPQEILDTIDEVAGIYSEYTPTIPLNSLEGYIRQLIGWREWMKGLSECEYQDNNIHEYNFFKAQNPLPEYFWSPSNSMDAKLLDNLPLRYTLEKVEKTGYNHHIERLMILANTMTLNEYSPSECYEWFMSMYIDAYEWVMKGNVLGMGLFADGGIFATKPYISGGNYIKKMSDFSDSKVWESLWTDQFWYFLLKHRTVFEKNPRMKMLISHHEAKQKKFTE